MVAAAVQTRSVPSVPHACVGDYTLYVHMCISCALLASSRCARAARAHSGGTQGEDRACPIAGVPPSEQLGGVWWDGDDCVPGCSVKGGRPLWCHGLGDYSGCAWEPRSLELMLQQQAKGGLKEQYNEVRSVTVCV